MTNPMSKAAILEDAKRLVNLFLKRGQLSVNPPSTARAPDHKTGQTHHLRRPRPIRTDTLAALVLGTLRIASRPMTTYEMYDKLHEHPNITVAAIQSIIAAAENCGKIKRLGKAEGPNGRPLILWKAK
jgi:hypothetical protein